MPVGVITNSLGVLAGAFIGAALGKHIPQQLKTSLPVVFGFVAITIGIMKIPSSDNLALVTLSLLLGTVLGEILGIDAWLGRGAQALLRRVPKEGHGHTGEASHLLVLAMVAFCVSGTGIFGALEEGVSGDSSILFSKAGLDFFTAMLFASVAGRAVALLSVPQVILMLALYFCGGTLSPYLSGAAKAAFLSVGGVITLMNGCAMAKITQIKAANTIPALVLVLLLSRILA